MQAVIEVPVCQETAADFIRALLHNLDQPEAAAVLCWTRDRDGAFHTRIHYGQAPVVISTDIRDGQTRFCSLMIQAVTQPLEPENADWLCAMIDRETLGEDASLADQLVARLAGLPPEDHAITCILRKFAADNR